MKLLPIFCILAFLGGEICRATQFGSEVKSYAFGTADIVRDDTRDRVYCTVPSQNSVVVIDTKTLKTLATIFTGSKPNGMSVSADGTLLYVANEGSTVQGLAVIDLQTLKVSRYIATSSVPSDVVCGNGTIYSLEGETIRAYNAISGSQLGGTLPNSIYFYGGIIDISPDRSTLYYFQTGPSPSSWFRINVSTWPGTLLQQGDGGSNGQDMALTADGQFITFAWGAPYSVQKLQANNPNLVYGQMDTGAYPHAVTYSPDGAYLFASHESGHIDVWDANTYLQSPEITASGQFDDLECDRAGKVLFAGGSTSLRVFYIATDVAPVILSAEVVPALEIRWDSIVGGVYQVEYVNQLNEPTWHTFGNSLTGTGFKMSAFDGISGSQSKFYRIRKTGP